jgi:hypothetical protein
MPITVRRNRAKKQSEETGKIPGHLKIPRILSSCFRQNTRAKKTETERRNREKYPSILKFLESFHPASDSFSPDKKERTI